MSRHITTLATNYLLLASFAAYQLAHAQSITVKVTDPRPVGEAVRMLEAIYGVPITYEDPIAVHESQLEDVTEKVRRDPDPTHDSDPSHRVIVQKEGTLSFTYKLPSSLPSQGGDPDQSQAETEAAVADALSSILSGYAASGGPVTFIVTKEDGVFHVVPTNFLNKDRKLQAMTPILDTRITIIPKQRTRQSLLDEICRSLAQASGIEVDCIFPFGVRTMGIQTTVSGSEVPARALLSQLLAELAAPVSEDEVFQLPGGEKETQHRILRESTGPLSWRLLYGFGSGYALNVHQVTLGGR